MMGSLTAANKEGKWGYIDRNNKAVIAFKYKQVLDFSVDGTRAFVQDFEDNWLLIDGSGSTLDSLDFNGFKSYEGDYCIVGKDGAWGLIDRSGKTVIEPQYLSLVQVDNCLFVAKKYDDYGIVNCDNMVIQDFKYQRITDAGNKLKIKEGNSYYYTDYDLKNKSPLYKKASVFEYGKAIVTSDEQINVIDESYEVLRSFDFDKVEHAGQGYFKSKQDGKWGLLSPTMEVLKEAKFFLLNKYQEDYILYAEASDEWGYLDKNGDIFIPAELPIAWEFKNGYARIFHPKGVGFINKSKQLVVDRRMFEVRDFYNGLARFQSLR